MQEVRKSQEPFVEKLKEPIIDDITSSLVRRYNLNFTGQDTSSLWFLCKQVELLFYFYWQQIFFLDSSELIFHFLSIGKWFVRKLLCSI